MIHRTRGTVFLIIHNMLNPSNEVFEDMNIAIQTHTSPHSDQIRKELLWAMCFCATP